MDGDYYNNEYFVNIQQLQPQCGFCQRIVGASYFVFTTLQSLFSHPVQFLFSGMRACIG